MKSRAVGMWTSHLLHHQTLKFQESLRGGGEVIIYGVILILFAIVSIIIVIVIAIVTNIKIANGIIKTIP